MGLIREEHILVALAVQMQLIPKIADLSYESLVDTLATPVDVAEATRAAERLRGQAGAWNY